ncbi:MAG: hypothetical protein OZX49_01838 [Immundisolibacter sp.]|jgi:hypothetical protein|nr:hypothetical protein [Immundisolibacter sp.]
MIRAAAYSRKDAPQLVWCFFAALLSAVVWLHFGRRKPAAPRAIPAGGT